MTEECWSAQRSGLCVVVLACMASWFSTGSITSACAASGEQLFSLSSHGASALNEWMTGAWPTLLSANDDTAAAAPQGDAPPQR